MGAAHEFIRQQSQYFDHLADLVDPKYYHDDGREPVNLKYMKKTARIATKQAFKEQYKQNKRAKLDPDAHKTTTELQRQQLDRGDASSDSEGEAGPGPGSLGLGVIHLSSGPAPTREELLARLRQKLQASREQRHAEQGPAAVKPKSAAEQAKDWRKQALGQKLKQKPGQHKGEQQQTAGAKRKQPEPVGTGAGQQQQQQQQQQPRRPQTAGATGPALVFNTLVVPEGGHKGHKQKKPTKEQLLRAAEEKQARLAAAGSSGAAAAAAGDGVASSEAWQAALARARGERVLDDPKLLRRSLKKDRKLKEKNAKKWQERTAAQQEAQQARQDKRKDNLAARAQTKLAKKKERREKKLLRAGFEGRKQGFIKPAAKK